MHLSAAAPALLQDYVGVEEDAAAEAAGGRGVEGFGTSAAEGRSFCRRVVMPLVECAFEELRGALGEGGKA